MTFKKCQVYFEPLCIVIQTLYEQKSDYISMKCGYYMQSLHTLLWGCVHTHFCEGNPLGNFTQIQNLKLDCLEDG